DFVRYMSGMSVTSPVDVNGDGYDDVVMEHSGHEGGVGFRAIDAYLGSPQGLPNRPSSISRIWQGMSHDAREIILFVDINGDGLDDILIEHNDPANWSVWRGEMNEYIEYDVFLNQGGAYPPSPHYTFQVPGNFSGYELGRWGLNDVGDFDGDGYGDVAIGIPDGYGYEWNEGVGEHSPHEHTRPGYLLIIHGKGVMERISGLVLVGEPNLYAAHSEGEIVANLVPLEGQGAILGASITLDPGGADVTIEWDPTASGNPFRIVEDHLGCIGLNSTAEDVETDAATGATQPHFRFVPGWEWPQEGPCTVDLTIETETGQVGPSPSPGLFNVVTTVEFQGPPTIRGHGNRLIEDGDWVRAGEQVNMTDLVLVYSGSEDIKAYLSGSLVATDNDGDTFEWPLGSKYLWQLSFFMDNETDVDEVLTISAKNLTGNAELREVLTVRLPVDGDLPTIGNPVPDDQDWHAVSSVLISITASDTDGSGVDPLSLEYSWRTRNASAWSDWSLEGLLVSIHGDQAEGLVTLPLRNGDENQVRWRARDRVGNGPAEFLQTIKVDTLNVSFADPFPDPDEWSLETMVECGVTITDLEGSGIDVTTVQYRVSPRNLSQYGEWLDWDEGDIGDARSVSTQVDVDLVNSGRNYVQWRAMDIAGNGLTTSPHYRVRVDATAPTFEEFSPGPDEFLTHTDVECEVVVHDNALGSGVDLSSVQYRYSLNGSAPHWSDWMDAGMTGSADGARFSVVLELSHGADNMVQFRCSDVAGNGPVESDEHHVAVDIEPPVILWIEPAEGEKQPDVTVNVRVAVRDDASGFGPNPIFCAYGTLGAVPAAPEYPLDDVEHDDGTIIGSTWLDLAPGVDNVVRFWVHDIVGNEAVSEVVSIWVNRPPLAVITSPSNGTTIWDTEELILTGGNSTDPDGDPLDHTWLLEGSPLKYGEVSNLSLEPGSYNITLVVQDDDGAEGRATVTVTVEEWVQPHTEEEPFGDWPLVVFVTLLLLVLAVAAILIWRTRVGERSSE
ncbi:MAG: hypothetical protein LN414_07425, partial [Candidatus Thermoplasmatota archaeon]|nr:hypothetical protein [Candidatus Thermoplasmatota archaeon]